MHHCPQCGSTLPAEPLLPDPGGRFDGHFACASCGLVSLMPVQTPDEIAALYTTKGNVELLAAEEARVPIERRLDRIAALVGPPDGRLLVEIGAGRGDFLAAAQERGWRVAGIEPASSGVEAARHRFGIDLERGIFTPDSTLPEPADVLCAWDVLEHCLEPHRILEAMLRAVRPGGLVLLAVPHVEGLPARLLRSRWRYRMVPKHVHFFPRRWFDDQAARHGAAVVDVQPFLKAHAAVQALVPTRAARRVRRLMKAASHVSPDRSPAARAPSEPSPEPVRLADMPPARRAVRQLVLRINQRPVPLAVADLIDVALRREG
ncbi:MAG: class I SAM-dependent methyltransferase [Deltaproteobacteria bacterium]|nr:MAG: class I SAM-dependent methyltransferase [Deltaproteobacteria bacterium]